jgi:hypothetical protein
MFWKYLEPIFAPFRKARANVNNVKNIKGNIKVDVKRAQGVAGNVKNQAGAAQAKAGALAGGAQGAAAGAQDAMQQEAPGGINPNPPIRTSGVLLWKKKTCTQCDQDLDKTWDACPFCADAAKQAAAANVPKAPMKTQAFMINSGGGGASTMQLLGWIVPLQGSQRGELFTLSPSSWIGTDPSCTVVLHDKFMSGKHAEIKAEGGVWILKDGGSTNGTYVNDKRVDKHELVDNDFIKFGGSLVKFKSL